MTAPDVNAVFGQNVRRLRKERKWTLKDLAARSGVTYPSISAIERAERGAGLRTADALARALGTTLDPMLADGPEGPTRGGETTPKNPGPS